MLFLPRKVIVTAWQSKAEHLPLGFNARRKSSRSPSCHHPLPSKSGRRDFNNNSSIFSATELAWTIAGGGKEGHNDIADRRWDAVGATSP